MDVYVMNNSWICSSCSYSNPSSAARCSLCNSIRSLLANGAAINKKSNSVGSLISAGDANGISGLSQQSSRLYSINIGRSNSLKANADMKRTVSSPEKDFYLNRNEKVSISVSEADIPISGEVTPSINAVSQDIKETLIYENTTQTSVTAKDSIKKEIVNKKEKHVKSKKRPMEESLTICGTMLSDADRDLLLGLINSYGSAKYIHHVTPKVNVVVTGESARSVKMMCAVGMGIPVVSSQWLYSCLEDNKWLDTSCFIDSFAKEGLENRKKRSKGVLSDSGFLYVAENTVPPRCDLLSIIRCCDGKVTDNIDEADIIVGKVDDHEFVKETFILDGVMKGVLPRISEYIVKSDEDESDEFFDVYYK